METIQSSYRQQQLSNVRPSSPAALTLLSDDVLAWCLLFLSVDEVLSLSFHVKSRRFYEVGRSDLLWDLLFQRDAPIAPYHQFVCSVMKMAAIAAAPKNQHQKQNGTSGPACTPIGVVFKELFNAQLEQCCTKSGFHYSAALVAVMAEDDAESSEGEGPFSRLSVVLNDQFDISQLLSEVSWMEIYLALEKVSSTSSLIASTNECVDPALKLDLVKLVSRTNNIRGPFFGTQLAGLLDGHSLPSNSNNNNSDEPKFRPSLSRVLPVWNECRRKLLVQNIINGWTFKSVLSLVGFGTTAYVGAALQLDSLVIRMLTNAEGTLQERRQRYLHWWRKLSPWSAKWVDEGERNRQFIGSRSFTERTAKVHKTTELLRRTSLCVAVFALLRVSRVHLLDPNFNRETLKTVPRRHMFVDVVTEALFAGLSTAWNCRCIVPAGKVTTVVFEKSLSVLCYSLTALCGAGLVVAVREEWRLRKTGVPREMSKWKRFTTNFLPLIVSACCALLCRKVPWKAAFFAAARRWGDMALWCSLGLTTNETGIIFSEAKRGDQTALISLLLGTFFNATVHAANQYVVFIDHATESPAFLLMTNKLAKKILSGKSLRHASKDRVDLAYSPDDPGVANSPAYATSTLIALFSAKPRQVLGQAAMRASWFLFGEEFLLGSLTAAVYLAAPPDRNLRTAVQFRVLVSAALKLSEWISVRV